MEPTVVFVVGSPSAIEKARGQALTGPMGETFVREYLEPAGLERSDVEVVYAFPTVLSKDRDPTPGEIARYGTQLSETIAPFPVVVALGKLARGMLDGGEDLYLPHPGAIRKMGDRGEVGRKIKKLIRLISLGQAKAGGGAPASSTEAPPVQKGLGGSGRVVEDDGDAGKLGFAGGSVIEVAGLELLDKDAPFEVGVAHDSMIEIFQKQGGLTSRSVVRYLGGTRWAIEKPDSDKPTAESETLAAYVAKLRIKKEQTLTWGAPGQTSRTIDVRTGRVALDSLITIAKIDAPQQIVTGAVLDPYTVDGENDWAPPAEIEATAQDWLAESRTIGFNHTTKADATPVQSYTFPYPSPEDRKAADAGEPHRAFEFQFGDETVHSGTWILSTKIHASEVWAQVEKGEINAYSIGGSGYRVDTLLEEMPDVEFIRIGTPK